MKITAKFLMICAAVLACMALWSYNKAHADTYVSTETGTSVTTTVLDSAAGIVKLDCEGTNISDMISECRKALVKACPEGGTVKEMGETPEGVLPAQVMLVVACRHESAI